MHVFAWRATIPCRSSHKNARSWNDRVNKKTDVLLEGWQAFTAELHHLDVTPVAYLPIGIVTTREIRSANKLTSIYASRPSPERRSLSTRAPAKKKKTRGNGRARGENARSRSGVPDRRASTRCGRIERCNLHKLPVMYVAVCGTAPGAPGARYRNYTEIYNLMCDRNKLRNWHERKCAC